MRKLPGEPAGARPRSHRVGAAQQSGSEGQHVSGSSLARIGAVTPPVSLLGLLCAVTVLLIL